MPILRPGDNPTQIPLAIGSQYSAGDPSTRPDGTVGTMRNYLFRPNRFDGSAPFSYDTLMSVLGLARWEDLTNQRTTTVAFDSAKLYKKPTTGVAWDSGTSGTIGTRLTGYTNYQGKLYVMFDNGSGTPSGVLVYDGTTISAAPFNSTIFARDIVTFIERNFLICPRVTVTPLTFTGVASPFTKAVYDLTSWSQSGCAARNIVSNGATVCRVDITSTTAGIIYTPGFGASGIMGVVATSDTKREFVWRADLRGNHPSYAAPFTMEIKLFTQWGSGATFAVGDLISDGTNRQRCTTAGTAGGAPPAWATTVGATTADGAGTLVWTCEGSAVLGSVEDSVPSATTSTEFTTFWASARVPEATNSQYVKQMLKWYNTANPTITLTSVDVSLRDGVTDGDPSKKNYGQQLTLGDFFFPFVNTETATTATVNLEDIIFSDIAAPKSIKASSTVSLPEVAGLCTAASVIGGRLIVFKRRGMWQYARTKDPNVPILPERPANVEIGCLGPRALDVWNDTLFWIGENEIYSMSVGEDPKPLCGPGMFEEIMARGSNWVESQSTYNLPLLAIDHANKDMWVYTQKAKIYIYNFATESWSYRDTPNGAEVQGMLFDYTGQRMLVSYGGGGVARFLETATTKDSYDNTGNTYSIVNDIVFKPLEGFAPRPQLEIQSVTLFHNATAAQAGETLTLSYSLDRGATYTTPPGYPVQVDITDPMIPLPIYATGNSITIKISRTGSGGAAKWSLSKAYATIRVISGEYPYVTAQSV